MVRKIVAVEHVTATTEEYLECIFRLQEKRGVARTSDIVKSLGVTPGTVTNTVEWLKKQDLVRHKPYKGVKLTLKGRKIALRVLRKHRLSERLLVDILHIEKDKAHDAACKLEHSITDDIIKPLEEALKHPKTCPHGNPIPTEKGEIVEEKSLPLSELLVGEQGTLTKITEERYDLLHYLNDLGLEPKVTVEVLEKAPFSGPITIRIGSNKHALSFAIAAIIHVKKGK